jgi:NAD(P)-dependent dehydrogenase (short-subunit alcohol dehydrogenase family)
MDYQQGLRLDGKGFVVLGAGQGIGLETTRALASAGASVLCVDRDENLARAVAAEVGAHHAVADVTKEADVEQVFKRAKDIFGDSFSGLADIVGMGDLRPIVKFSEDEWDQQFSMVLRHVFFAIKHAAATFPESGGSMVFVSSLAGTRSIEEQGVYGAAKAALNHLVATSALELGQHNIRVNAVAPGIVKTPRVSSILGDERLDSIAEIVPLRRACMPEDIAAAILFLSSPLAGCISGTVLPVDGGIVNVSIFPRLEVGATLVNARVK